MYNKTYYERYALLSLNFFYDKNFRNFSHGEKPDIQNKKDSIGIEVTRGISEYEGKFSRLCSECTEENLSLDERFARAGKMFRKNFLGVFHESNGWVITDPENGVADAEIHIARIISKIKSKTEKLEKIYTKFNTNCLYIFSEYPLKSANIETLAGIMFAENLAGYDIYFINATDRVYVIDAKNGFKFLKHKFTSKELSNFKKRASRF